MEDWEAKMQDWKVKMHHRIFKLCRLDRMIKLFGYCLVSLYIVSMFIYPWFDNQWKWGEVQSVWSHWQTMNVGALAFLSSVILYKATKYQSESQRQRNFIASRAFLPESFSELLGYLEQSSEVLKAAWQELDRKGRLAMETPPLPTNYKSIFSDCISHAPNDFGDYLAKFLVNLQIHDARLSSLVEETQSSSLSQMNLISYMFRLAEMVVYINKAFEYARGQVDFDDRPFSADDFKTAYMNMAIDVEDYGDLWASTERFIQRYHPQS